MLSMFAFVSFYSRPHQTLQNWNLRSWTGLLMLGDSTFGVQSNINHDIVYNNFWSCDISSVFCPNILFSLPVISSVFVCVPQGKAFFHQHVSKLLNLINVAVPQEPNLLALFLSLSFSLSLHPSRSSSRCAVCVFLWDGQPCWADRAGQWVISRGTIALFVKMLTDGMVLGGMWWQEWPAVWNSAWVTRSAEKDFSVALSLVVTTGSTSWSVVLNWWHSPPNGWKALKFFSNFG